MTTTATGVDLIRYSHDRENNYKTTADELFDLVNRFTDQEHLSGLYDYFEKKYKLPESVVKKKIRQNISKSYLFKSSRFSSVLYIKSIPLYVLRYGALIYALCFTKKKCNTRKFKLIIDGIRGSHELSRFNKLLHFFGDNNVLCVADNTNIKQDFPRCHIYNKKIFRDLILVDLLKSIANELFIGVWVVLVTSIKTKVNLFPVSLQIIHSYLYYKALFESNSAEYMIQERSYETNPIKNYIFNKLGGVASTAIQKNIFQADPIFFYIDIDTLFSLGVAGYNLPFEYGGRIDYVKPVGSLFMEYYWFRTKYYYKKKYDIAILGINTSNAYERLDSYSKFIDDYYSLYRWVAKLSNDNPKYNIVLIHHDSAGNDDIENNILLGSNVKVLDNSCNSYEVAFSSKCAITYGSTMGYELNAHNLPTFFIDPGYRCSFLPEKGQNYIDKMRINTYVNFRLLMYEIIHKVDTSVMANENTDMWCLESSQVSNVIYSYFINRASSKSTSC